ncbi:hypothetical protein [Rhizorhabdus phycosphaerae]|uniref:hypothetical protein n=1 Tax=Rhizorhabdus phycosphaerae TaxID=2711156 RepID=UPI0013EAC84F|nr:hypothetical protein [Rhizorhabdus phycosphaerae]
MDRGVGAMRVISGRWIIPIFGLGCIYFAMLGRAAFFGFVTDDFFLMNLSYKAAIDQTLTGPHFRPLWFLSYPFLNSMFGQSAFAHHAANLLLHAANCALAFLWLRTGLGSVKAGFAVLVWTMLPQTVFPAVWISQRNDALMAFFLLLCLIAHQRDHRLSAYLLYILAFLSKVTCMFFPLVFLTTKGLRRNRRDLIAGLLLLLLSVAIAAYSLQHMESPERLANLGPAMRGLNHFKNLVLGWFTLVVPIPFFATPVLAWAYLLCATGVGWLLLKCRSSSPTTRQLLIFAVVMSLPLAMAAEVRITYVQSLFLTAAIFSAIDPALISARRRAKIVLLITVVAGLIYTVPAAYLTTEKFHSTEYSVSKPSAEPSKILYLFDFYGWFRDFQSRLLHGG